MTDSHEPSYYEIALTNRQVVVAFVILLVCLMGTFFAGVWVGRGEAPTQTADRTAEQAESEAGDLETLDFFGGGEEQEGENAQPRRQEASRQEPPREDPVVQRNRRQAAEQASPQDLAGGEGPALSEDVPPTQPSTQPSTPPPTQPPTTTRPRVQEETPSPAREPAPPGGRLVEGPVVQVFSSANREQAQAVVDDLTDGGQPAYLSPVDVDGLTMYRVRIGPFQDRAQAERVAEQVKRAYRLDTWITQ